MGAFNDFVSIHSLLSPEQLYNKNELNHIPYQAHRLPETYGRQKALKISVQNFLSQENLFTCLFIYLHGLADIVETRVKLVNTNNSV